MGSLTHSKCKEETGMKKSNTSPESIVQLDLSDKQSTFVRVDLGGA